MNEIDVVIDEIKQIRIPFEPEIGADGRKAGRDRLRIASLSFFASGLKGVTARLPENFGHF